MDFLCFDLVYLNSSIALKVFQTLVSMKIIWTLDFIIANSISLVLGGITVVDFQFSVSTKPGQ
ncbi:hypothetical protein KTT_56660 [Tengunoibacter tsumagoiensis]|uniref:Uncharacterized protein n=1 Tax=Tengunoibacter tsumagoiensis TaxID=2014871 RepID=A0A402A9F6_9CHLR|nr:hypothetical protein KTT_56660 [Tengunoibacter tsumagoiensis]